MNRYYTTFILLSVQLWFTQNKQIFGSNLLSISPYYQGIRALSFVAYDKLPLRHAFLE